MNKYTFLVPCEYEYEIEANTEREARAILIEKGGIDIEGEPHFTDHAYTLDAVLFEKNEVQRWKKYRMTLV